MNNKEKAKYLLQIEFSDADWQQDEILARYEKVFNLSSTEIEDILLDIETEDIDYSGEISIVRFPNGSQMNFSKFGTEYLSLTLGSVVRKKWKIEPGPRVVFTDVAGYTCYTYDFLLQGSFIPNLKANFNLSQDEIDQIMDELAKQKLADENAQLSFQSPYFGIINPKDYNIWKDNQNSDTKICKHEWVSYLGLNESYEFCKLCDEKKK